MKRVRWIIMAGVVLTSGLFAQKEGDVIINEIGNNGTRRAMYTGGDYVELLVVKPGGVRLGGWYLTDMSGQGSEPKESEGYVRFSGADSSVFAGVIAQGTYILVCLGKKADNYGDAQLAEDVALDDGNNRIVVFAYDSPAHMDPGKGTIAFTGKDNVALLLDWKKAGAIDIVTWEGSSSWTGAAVTVLPSDAINNGIIAYFVPPGKTVADFSDNSPAECWKSVSDVKQSTPGLVNPGVDDSELKATK